jgi:hypothetical protein
VTHPQDVAEVLRGSAGRDPSRSPSSVNVGTAERWVSALAGAGLAMAGLSRRSPAGTAMAAAGGMLLWRGIGGSCPLYAVLGWSTAVPMPTSPDRGADRWAIRPTVPFGEAGSRLGQTGERRLEEDLEQSFPASDVPAHMGGTTLAGSAPGRSGR